MEYIVIKRIVNDYEVIVHADSPEDAIRQAYKNNHEPGHRTTDYSDGDCHKPTEWLVFDGNPGADGLQVNRESLADLESEV